MLTENKFNKYLLYAMGEIILVVIGILIALSINNWNENRKINKITNSLYENLFAELLEAKEHMESSLSGNDMHILFLENILYNWKTLDKKKVMDLIPDMHANQNFPIIFYLTGFSQFYDPEYEMYSTSVNDGTISLIDKDFIAILSSTYLTGNYRLNQFINEEYALSREINKHISETYKDIFIDGERTQSNDWDDLTYEKFFKRLTSDGKLKYSINNRLQKMKIRSNLMKGDLLRFERGEQLYKKYTLKR